MLSPKREALERLSRALVAYDGGKINGGDLNRIEAEVLEVEGVKPQNVRDLKASYRESLVKNTH